MWPSKYLTDKKWINNWTLFMTKIIIKINHELNLISDKNYNKYISWTVIRVIIYKLNINDSISVILFDQYFLPWISNAVNLTLRDVMIELELDLSYWDTLEARGLDMDHSCSIQG